MICWWPSQFTNKWKLFQEETSCQRIEVSEKKLVFNVYIAYKNEKLEIFDAKTI